jgi:hypothetical protein
MVLREEELFEEWYRTAPVIVAPGSLTAPPLGNGQGHRERAAAARARREFSDNPFLASLTTEESYVAAALRKAG